MFEFNKNMFLILYLQNLSFTVHYPVFKIPVYTHVHVDFLTSAGRGFGAALKSPVGLWQGTRGGPQMRDVFP